MGKDNSMTAKFRNKNIDVLRGIACLGVVLIHVRFPGQLGLDIVALARSCVAIFFVTAGYFCFKNDALKMEERAKKKAKDTFKLLIIAFSLYFIWESSIRFAGSGYQSVFAWWDTLFQGRNLIRVVLLHEDPIAGHLWFLPALISCYLLQILACRFGFTKKLSYLSIVAFLLGLILMGSSTILKIGLPMQICRNGWFYGIPMFQLGLEIRRKQERGRILEPKISLVLLIIGTIVTLLEYQFIGYLQVYAGTVLMVIGSMELAIQPYVIKGDSYISILGQRCSSIIYISHWGIMELFDKIQSVFQLDKYLFWLWIKPLIVIFFAIIFAGLVELIKGRLNSWRGSYAKHT